MKCGMQTFLNQSTGFCMKVYSFRFRKFLCGCVWSCALATRCHNSPLFTTSCDFCCAETLPSHNLSVNLHSSTALATHLAWRCPPDQHIWSNVRVGTDFRMAYPSILIFSIILTSPSLLMMHLHLF